MRLRPDRHRPDERTKPAQHRSTSHHRRASRPRVAVPGIIADPHAGVRTGGGGYNAARRLTRPTKTLT